MMRCGLRRHAKELLVADSEAPVVWATAQQPLRLAPGWKLEQTQPSGCVYMHPKYGIASFRGIEDDAGRKWMNFTLLPTCPITLEDVRVFRLVFFPDRAIVAMAIEPGSGEMLNMWWSVDEKGLPMDPDWKAVMTPDTSHG